MKRVKKMSNLGIFASRFEINIRTLKEFDKALSLVRKGTESEKEIAVVKLREIIKPINEKVNGQLSSSILFSEGEVTSILHQRNISTWPTYKKGINYISEKLMNNETTFSHEEFVILEDIADALDAECELLFRRMSERR